MAAESATASQQPDDVPSECPTCHQLAVVFDYLQGISACELCGRVAGGEELVDTHPTGILVKSNGSELMRTSAGSKLRGVAAGPGNNPPQRTVPSKSLYKLIQQVKHVAQQLSLPAAVTAEAEAYLEPIYAVFGTCWRQDYIPAAAVYVSIRQNNLLLTLLDLASVVQVDVFALGRYYLQATAALNLLPPQVPLQSLLVRALHKVLKETPVAPAVSKDAAFMLQWMEDNIVDSCGIPMTRVAVSVVIALEMNNVCVGVDYVANALQVGMESLTKRLQQVKDNLLSFAYLLPYAAKINSKNVCCHAEAITRVANVLVFQKQRQQQQQQQQKQKQIEEKEARAPPAPVETLENRDDARRPKKSVRREEEVSPPSKKRSRENNKKTKKEAPPRTETMAVTRDDLNDNEEEDELGSDVDVDWNEYIMSPEEVALRQQLYAHFEGEDGSGDLAVVVERKKKKPTAKLNRNAR